MVVPASRRPPVTHHPHSRPSEAASPRSCDLHRRCGHADRRRSWAASQRITPRPKAASVLVTRAEVGTMIAWRRPASASSRMRDRISRGVPTASSRPTPGIRRPHRTHRTGLPPSIAPTPVPRQSNSAGSETRCRDSGRMPLRAHGTGEPLPRFSAAPAPPPYPARGRGTNSTADRPRPGWRRPPGCRSIRTSPAPPPPARR